MNQISVATLLPLFALAATAFGRAEVGKPLPPLQLSGKEGGIVDGRPWDSASMRGNPTVILYIDPDNREDNEHLQRALKDSRLGERGLRSVAIINMAATWLPNFAIAEKMAAKQKEFPRTPQVKDLNRKAIGAWGIKDDAYDVILVDKNLQVLFLKNGKLTDDEVKQVVELIESETKNSPNDTEGPKIDAPPASPER